MAPSRRGISASGCHLESSAKARESAAAGRYALRGSSPSSLLAHHQKAPVTPSDDGPTHARTERPDGAGAVHQRTTPPATPASPTT